MNRWEKPQNDHIEIPSVILAGSVVVAAPWIMDNLFGRSVCIVVEHTPERSVGIVLNKRLDADVQPIWEHILQGATIEEGSLAHVNFGGPASGPIIAIHKDRDLAEGGNNLGVYLAAEADHLKQLALTHGVDYRLFVGHAIWGPRELERQIVAGAWHVLPAIPELVFDDESMMWHRAMRSIGNELLQSITGLPVSEISGTLN